MARVARRSGLEWMWAVAEAGWRHPMAARLRGVAAATLGVFLLIAFATYRVTDPSLNAVSGERPHNLMGRLGADAADLGLQSLGLGAWLLAIVLLVMGLGRIADRDPDLSRPVLRRRMWFGLVGLLALAGVLTALPTPATWPLARGLGGFWGDSLLNGFAALLRMAHAPGGRTIGAGVLAVVAAVTLGAAVGLGRLSPMAIIAALTAPRAPRAPKLKPAPRHEPEVARARQERPARRGVHIELPADPPAGTPAAAAPESDEDDADPRAQPAVKTPRTPAPRGSDREQRENQQSFDFVRPSGFHLPELSMLAKPKPRSAMFDEGALRQNARMLESVLAEFGVKGTVDQIRAGPVVTLYELVPAPGVKSARVVALSDDIARSMSVAACRVSVVQGRNAIGIELPNTRRETVYLRDLLAAPEFERASQNLPLALGESIGGEPYIVDLSKMPHLLIAGTTGSGKSVGVNAMILSILYRLAPHQCRFIMIDPKMLELSVYDGIPHLLAPVVTDPKKAIVALKWTVREMEDRYRKMSKIGVRNVAGYNEKALEAQARGEHFVRTVQTGFDEQGRPVYEEEKLRPEPMPYLVVVIDEVADLMMVAGKDIEGAVQRLAQMARAAGIHLIMATQRPSVDVITGTIKANFPTRISFQVTSKIDSRTIMGEQGAEQLLGQGDMLYMAGGGRITRLHGPFVSDGEVEAVAKFLRDQGEPQYLEEITAGGDDEDGEGGDMFGEGGGSGDDLYDRAVAVVTRDRKASTSYIQRRLQIGYNRAASLMERMEQEGIVGPANHAGKRDILAGPPPPI
ncbi:DNA translocase FtsK [Phenylobacterium montanum]|uniref:DNA translocase FtsK n=1 Tax=Phenylobacterium montanum TaxID=2823693 RepID=A0A975ITN9_9CAUL|nr:DNA translocase FtsK [Caulobacter sp. S6]QUD86669.1 DNA translocase FtsK [Caulobacter sp. S6]